MPIEVGARLGPLERTIRIQDMVAYAAATWDFVRIHYDAEYARSRGLPGPIVDGQMLGGYLGSFVCGWGSRGSVLRSLTYRNRRMVVPDDAIRVEGEVVEVTVQPNGTLVRCSLTMKNQRGEEIVTQAGAVLWVPAGSDGFP